MHLQILFGRRVRQMRLKAGLTQEQLGQAVRLSAVSISNIERGVYPPAFRRLEDLAQALGVEVYELFFFGTGTE